MIGYDVGARMQPGGENSGRADERVDAPMHAEGTGNVPDVAEALSGAAALAGRIHGERGDLGAEMVELGGKRLAAASDGDASAVSIYPDYGGMAADVGAPVGVPSAGAQGREFEAVLSSGFPGAAGAAVQSGGGDKQEFVSFSDTGAHTGRRDDDGTDGDHLGKFDDVYAKVTGESGGDGKDGAAAGAGGGASLLDAAMEPAAGFGHVFAAAVDGVGHAASKNAAALYDRSDGSVAHFFSGDSVPDGGAGKNDAAGGDASFGRLIGIKLGSDDIGAGASQNELIEEAAGQRSSDGVDVEHPAGMPVAKAVSGFAGLWEMLKGAERVLPKSELAGRTGEDAGARVGEDVAGVAGSWAGLHADGMVDGLGGQVPHAPAGQMAPGGGRNGPSGHRNDPIYTVAVGAMVGSVMPMVPTAGSSTRSPPIPGQRNLA